MTPRFSVSGLIAVLNQVLEASFVAVEIEGEVANFKVNQQKFVFFDLKDEEGLLGCFMTVWQLKIPIEDGMRVVLRATPKLTAWGKFSLTVQAIRPIGEGSLKRSMELLQQKLEGEGLFDLQRKRSLPLIPGRVGVISSVESAGYKDFIKILEGRWGGLEVEVAPVQVQGESSPEQIVRAIEYFNSQSEPPEVLVLIRGGGSAEDLAGFSDERVVRAVAASRTPTLVGVGHEVDQSLSDLAADVRASTPTHAAQLLVPDRQEVKRQLGAKLDTVYRQVAAGIKSRVQLMQVGQSEALLAIDRQSAQIGQRLAAAKALVRQFDPELALKRGYSLVRSQSGAVDFQPELGQILEIDSYQYNIQAEVKNVKTKHQSAA